eukprot:scaffold22746_cov52-Attheya_sp.AAC.6
MPDLDPRVKSRKTVPTDSCELLFPKAAITERQQPAPTLPSNVETRCKPGPFRQASKGRKLRVGPPDAPFNIAKGKKSCPKKLNQKSRSLMQHAAWVQFHPFAKTLKSWEQGVPVDCGPDWSPDTCRLAIEKGAHRSGMTVEAIKLVHEDVKYQVDAGFSRIVL